MSIWFAASSIQTKIDPSIERTTLRIDKIICSKYNHSILFIKYYKVVGRKVLNLINLVFVYSSIRSILKREHAYRESGNNKVL